MSADGGGGGGCEPLRSGGLGEPHQVLPSDRTGLRALRMGSLVGGQSGAWRPSPSTHLLIGLPRLMCALCRVTGARRGLGVGAGQLTKASQRFSGLQLPIETQLDALENVSASGMGTVVPLSRQSSPARGRKARINGAQMSDGRFRRSSSHLQCGKAQTAATCSGHARRRCGGMC